MSSFLYRVGRFAAHRRWWVIAAWLLLVIGAQVGGTALGGTLASSFSIPGTQAQTALDTLEQRFPQTSGASVKIVLHAPAGDSVDADADAVAAVCEQVAALPEATLVTCPVPMSAAGSTAASDGSPAQISADGEIAYVSVQLSVASTAITPALGEEISAAAAPAVAAGLAASYAGLPAESSGDDITELMGLAIAFVVLAVTFGAVLAAGIPLVTAALGVALATGSILIVAAFVPVSSTAPLLATMLGLAVGIDYALLIVSRHRAQLKAGMEVRDSIAVAIATAGTAVVFAGLTVMIALIGLSVAGIPFLSVMGLGAATAVLAAIAVAVTLLPALLAVFGRLLRPRVRSPRHARPPRPARPAWWVRATTRVPVATLVLAGLALVVVALPATQLRLTLPDAGYDPPGSTARTAYDLLDQGFGPGTNGPLVIAADISATLDIEGAMTALDDAFANVPDVAAVSSALPNQAADLLVVIITPDSAPSSEQTTALVQRLRTMAPAFEAEHGFTYQVTGSTALAIDISDRLSKALVPFGMVVVGLCLVLLTIMFRSIAVPITATLGYLLSVGAALGVTTVVFVWGWGADVLGVGKVGPVISFLPILVMAVLFGLAMDYHVFLVSRMRERFAATGDAHDAVRTGFSASARVVTAAALIMFAVFFSFVPGGNAIIQPLALALAVGVLIDAFVVRMTLIPAAMALLGDRAWWLPRWLGRILPDADIEGEAVERMLTQREWLTGPGADRSRGVWANDARVAGGAPVSLTAPDGALLVIGGDPVAAARIVGAIAGRVPDVTGDLAVGGRLLPFDRAAIAAAAAYVPAAPADVDATTLAEHLCRGLASQSVGLSRAREATARAAQAFDALTGVLAGPAARRILPETPFARLSDAERWAADAAIALASALPIIALDLGGRPAANAVLAAILAHADAGSTLVVAADVGAVPPTTRPVVTIVAGSGVREEVGA
ncbi:MAG: MMPL family transporter [Microbacterium sp.]|uniref:MMPL family transporter n=1 Tax=Microbacterium sp. TaxID=51671 RepID=UPI002639847E|nr:MMPL family transporter [Microbacterium sp.]MCX6500908.1 MMPL family transporter [Microbacterium sp.]